MTTATRPIRSRKMTKEDSSDTVAADTATTEDTAKGPKETENDEITASVAGETVVLTTEKADAEKQLAGEVERIPGSTSKEEEITKVKGTATDANPVTVTAGEVSLKPDAATIEANLAVAASDTAVGEVELTANFPQKVCSLNVHTIQR